MATQYYISVSSVKYPKIVISENGAGMVYYHISSMAAFGD